MKSEAFSYTFNTLRQMFNALSLLLVVSSGYKPHSTCPVYSPAIKSLFLPKSCFHDILMTLLYKFRGLALFGSLLANFYYFHATLITSWKNMRIVKLSFMFHSGSELQFISQIFIVHMPNFNTIWAIILETGKWLTLHFWDWKMMNNSCEHGILELEEPLRSYPTPLLSSGGCRIKPAKTGGAKTL